MKRINLLHNTAMGINTIGRYKIISEIGHGAMGTVYKGNDTIIDRIIAIKTIKLSKTQSPIKEKELIDLFYREVRIAGKLSHPNIGFVYDAGEYYDTHYFIMEYVEGVSMKKIIQEGVEITLKNKLKVLLQIANALHYAHQRGVIHRDIKPANIMMLDDMQVKIMDFGVAMLTTSTDTISASSADKIMGTPSYMSPEQTQGDSLDRKTDIFSLGALAYEFLTGQKPFQGNNLDELFAIIRNQDPKPPHEVSNNIPEELSECIMKCLKKDKEKRYNSANEFADYLEMLLTSTDTAEINNMDYISHFSNREFLQTLKDKYEFFADFTYDELHQIFKISSKLDFEKGHVIFAEGSMGKTMYIILTGRVRIVKFNKYSNKNIVLGILRTGDCFGEMAFIESAPRYAAAVADTESSLLEINEVILRNEEPRICLKLYKNLVVKLSEKLRKSNDKFHQLLAKHKKDKEPT
ncbi:serine/threonine protein kinase with PASTA sensor(s) [Candidatus Magnetoovum chiemensis]|nr:serine/threonine protein kinase with PASTA sensor(s) [Candidatus Magnetoovum chiemensis]